MVAIWPDPACAAHQVGEITALLELYHRNRSMFSLVPLQFLRNFFES
jgi:hypothetical protein